MEDTAGSLNDANLSGGDGPQPEGNPPSSAAAPSIAPLKSPFEISSADVDLGDLTEVYRDDDPPTRGLIGRKTWRKNWREKHRPVTSCLSTDEHAALSRHAEDRGLKVTSLQTQIVRDWLAGQMSEAAE